MEKILDRNIDLGPYVPQPDDDIIICRCEEVTKGEIRQAVHDGMWNLNEIRRYLRTGMGLCQGLTCGKLVQGIVAGSWAYVPTSWSRTPPVPPPGRWRCPFTEMRSLKRRRRNERSC